MAITADRLMQAHEVLTELSLAFRSLGTKNGIVAATNLTTSDTYIVDLLARLRSPQELNSALAAAAEGNFEL